MDAAASPRDAQTTRYLLGIIALLVAAVAFWVIASPHEQCYIGQADPLMAEIAGKERITGQRYPIERNGENLYLNVPSQFRAGTWIAADAVIECGWELGR